MSKRTVRDGKCENTKLKSDTFKPTKVVPANLCIEFKPREGVAVAVGSLEEPITDWLIHEGLGITATNEDDTIGIAFGNGPVLA